MSTGGDANTIGKYRLVNCVASGQSCQVWEVIDSETTRRMAMKLLLPEKLTDSDVISALKHEFNVASSFDHPNILKYHELFVKKKQAYFTMDLFPAPSLKTQLFSDMRGVHMRLKRMVELVAMALEHIHEKGWLHRDLKPDNILMNKSAEVRLIDFSLASKAAGALSKMLHRKSTVQGTRTYMAPEQILGKSLTVQTDIYNFGVTLFELLTGQPPFKGSTPKDLLLRHLSEPCPAPTEFNPNVTDQMSMVVQRMLSKKPENRHKKIAEFMAEFRNTPLFKEEVTEKVELTEKQKAEKELQATLGERLDSRTDALRTQFGVAAPPPKKKKAPVVLPAATGGAKRPAAGQGGAPPGAPYPPQPMPMQPMMPGQMPMPQYPNAQYPNVQYPNMPYPNMPMPQGPTPWVTAMSPGQMPGMPAGPWGQPPQAMPPMAPPAAAAPLSPPMPAPVVPRPMPVPPPAAVPAAPAPPVPRVAQPPVPAKPAKPAPKAAPPVKPGEGFHIGDLAGFDDLPPVS
ncbi:MAG: serine/threonine protein kinase [Planctomycetia bacterium]|nr:serine/threonine protein kinase [Planctomycetia bacterium]